MPRAYQKRDNGPGQLIPIGGPDVIPPARCDVKLVSRMGRWPCPGRRATPHYYCVTLPNLCRFGRITLPEPIDTAPVFTFYQLDSGSLWFLQYVPQRIGSFFRRPLRTPDLGATLVRYAIDGSFMGSARITPPTEDVLGDGWRSRGPLDVAAALDLYVGGDYWR